MKEGTERRWRASDVDCSCPDSECLDQLIGDADPRSTQWPSELLIRELVEFNSRSRYSTAVPIVRGFSRWEKHKESQSLLSIIWQSVSHSLTNNFQRAVHCAQWKYCSWTTMQATGAGDFSEAILYSVSSQTQCVPWLQLGRGSWVKHTDHDHLTHLRPWRAAIFPPAWTSNRPRLNENDLVKRSNASIATRTSFLHYLSERSKFNIEHNDINFLKIYTVSQKGSSIINPITPVDIDRFSIFFHCWTPLCCKFIAEFNTEKNWKSVNIC